MKEEWRVKAGKKAMKTNKARYGENFPEMIGAAGGHASKGTGFAMATPEQRSEWGRKGGLKSRKNKKKTFKEKVSSYVDDLLGY